MGIHEFNDGFDEEPYIPSEEEEREMEKIFNEQRELDDKKQKLFSTRKLYTFNSEAHWIGWLKVNGIRWP
jgi:hypothetical protein